MGLRSVPPGYFRPRQPVLSAFLPPLRLESGFGFDVPTMDWRQPRIRRQIRRTDALRPLTAASSRLSSLFILARQFQAAILTVILRRGGGSGGHLCGLTELRPCSWPPALLR